SRPRSEAPSRPCGASRAPGRRRPSLTRSPAPSSGSPWGRSSCRWPITTCCTRCSASPRGWARSVSRASPRPPAPPRASPAPACRAARDRLPDGPHAARRPRRGRVPGARRVRPRPPRLLFLVPAHDEEALIGSCVQSLRRLRYPADAFAVWVVADNCSDRTAALARQAGACCLERTDPARPGKPHAVAWALARLPIRDFDAVAIIDADTVVDPGFARGLAAAAPLRAKVVQPFNGVRNPADNALTRLAAVLATANHGLAFLVKT